jgi:hypothetical protein
MLLQKCNEPNQNTKPAAFPVDRIGMGIDRVRIKLPAARRPSPAAPVAARPGISHGGVAERTM